MFTARLATAVVLLAACISALLWLPNVWWTALLLPVLLGAGWEWGGLAGLPRGGRWIYALLLVATAGAAWAVVLVAPGLETWLYGGAAVFWLTMAPAWLALGWRVRSLPALAVVGWVVLVPSWLALARLQADPHVLLATLGVIWLSDTAAYLAGRAWGKRKLAPSISPGKTWEGIAGAGAAVAVYYVVLSLAAPALSETRGAAGAALFAAVAVLGVVGDLFESWIKRQAAVKDSGGLLPGHGGVLDRIDSITAALPVAALLLMVAGHYR